MKKNDLAATAAIAVALPLTAFLVYLSIEIGFRSHGLPAPPRVAAYLSPGEPPDIRPDAEP